MRIHESAWVVSRRLTLQYLFAVVWKVRNGERGAVAAIPIAEQSARGRGLRIIPRYARTSAACAGSIVNAIPASGRGSAESFESESKHTMGREKTREAFNVPQTMSSCGNESYKITYLLR